MAEAGVYLMPIYAVASWIGLFVQGDSGKYVLPIAVVGWVWAGVNTIRNGSLDLGVVTFFLVSLSALWEKRSGLHRWTRAALIVSSILLALNYALVPIMWGQISEDLAGAKSPLWMDVFFGYCVCMIVFWVVVAVRTWMRGETGYDAENASKEDNDGGIAREEAHGII